MAHDIVRTLDAIERRYGQLEATPVGLLDVVLGRCVDKVSIDFAGLTRVAKAAAILDKELKPDDLLYVACEGLSVSSLVERVRAVTEYVAPLKKILEARSR